MPIKLAGRPKGAQNKLSKDAKENIHAVFVRLGSTAAMAKWAEANPTEFYKIYSKLVAVTLNHGVTGELTELLTAIDGRTRGIPKSG